MIARDQSCAGCGAPAARCQIHHIRYRRNGGPTVTANLVLLCWACHHGVHHLGWTIHGDPVTGFSLTRHPHPPTTSGNGDPPRHSP